LALLCIPISEIVVYHPGPARLEAVCLGVAEWVWCTMLLKNCSSSNSREGVKFANVKVNYPYSGICNKRGSHTFILIPAVNVGFISLLKLNGFSVYCQV
jgi:hypothetical protein